MSKICKYLYEDIYVCVGGEGGFFWFGFVLYSVVFVLKNKELIKKNLIWKKFFFSIFTVQLIKLDTSPVFPTWELLLGQVSPFASQALKEQAI